MPVPGDRLTPETAAGSEIPRHADFGVIAMVTESSSPPQILLPPLRRLPALVTELLQHWGNRQKRILCELAFGSGSLALSPERE